MYSLSDNIAHCISFYYSEKNTAYSSFAPWMIKSTPVLTRQVMYPTLNLPGTSYRGLPSPMVLRHSPGGLHEIQTGLGNPYLYPTDFHKRAGLGNPYLYPQKMSQATQPRWSWKQM